MTRILYWNIQNFSMNKLKAYTSIGDADAANSRLECILGVIAPGGSGVQRPLDIIIIVEVFARNKEVTTKGVVLPSDTKSGKAVLSLLAEIRKKLGDTWCLVPPLMGGKYGKREAVAVYYNSTTLTFTGPYVYAAAYNDVEKSLPPIPANLQRLRDYGSSWRAYQPTTLNRTWTAGATAVPESRGAGRIEYGVNFPGEDDRPPFLIRMLDVAGRTIKVLAVHTSPGKTAKKAVERIAGLSDVTNVGANEVSVVVGDFNVDSFSEEMPYNNMENTYYYLRTAYQYTMLLDPCLPGPPRQNKPNPSRRAYCLTHLLPSIQTWQGDEYSIATPYNANGRRADPQHNVYPRLGYMGGMSKGTENDPPEANDTGAIDNAFVRYGGGLAVAVPHNTTIVNMVVGQPYTAIAAPAGVTPDLTSGLPQARMLLDATLVPPGGVDPGGNVKGFNDWDNYGRIYATSDHLPIIFDV